MCQGLGLTTTRSRGFSVNDKSHSVIKYSAAFWKQSVAVGEKREVERHLGSLSGAVSGSGTQWTGGLIGVGTVGQATGFRLCQQQFCPLRHLWGFFV